ncbi:MAG: phage GP46 family protein [Candidatus Omnitrophica bacterium]|nr:phage GP46 family protein [Candidatus Omnitrophota bacterium]
MATDIKIRYDNDLAIGDFNFLNGDLEREEGLETSVLISLYTDARVNEDDAPDNPSDLRGWIGDLLPSRDDNIGSKLWLLDRSKATQENANKAKEYVQQALKWMIEDGVASKIDVVTSIVGYSEMKKLVLEITIYKHNDKLLGIKFNDIWEAQYELN